VNDPGQPPLNADEAISAMDLLSAFTSGSAYVNHLEADTGSLEVGKLADFAVMDRNPLEEDRLAGTRVAMTIVCGQVVYEEA